MPYLTLIQITGPGFCAAIEVDDRVRTAAPILRAALLGKRKHEAAAIVQRRGWSASIVPEHQGHPPHDPTHQRGS